VISENKEIIYSIKKSSHPVPVVQVTATRRLYNTTAPCAAPAMILYSREDDQPLYPLGGGKEEVEMIKVELGSYAFAAQYQQNPLPLSSGIIKLEWLKRHRNFPDDLSHVTQSLDTAVSTSNSSNFSICTTGQKWAINSICSMYTAQNLSIQNLKSKFCR
jgi:hypothetical protein